MHLFAQFFFQRRVFFPGITTDLGSVREPQLSGRFAQHQAQVHHPVQLQRIAFQLPRKTQFSPGLPNSLLSEAFSPSVCTR